MDMKNTNGISRIDPVGPVRPDRGRANVRQEATQRDTPAEQVTLTPTAQRLVGASGESTPTTPLDRARLDAIREAIATGRYKIDAERIAAGLIRIESGLPR